ncbi:MAG: hypothetical protein DM484_20055 [Candidatus Methylumidiphilus alinenensis]|uniref:Uncharacterized protein n=1 Tax=Candidatus Methylumidiphilus alinenensis TaxID=2202197 RepID=A0A2W4SWA0_9GAMM|nr:MAG: hypothetical protein DM484_20055 [Candidatus Methylumidiphilus alinenensis]
MDKRRKRLLSHFKSIKEPVALPTVQTMDIGLEYVAASSEGANTTLGRYGSWPVLGPFILKTEDIRRLQQIAVEGSKSQPFAGMQIDYVWQEVEEMFAYRHMEESERLEFQSDFVKAIIEQKCNHDSKLYVYFHKFDPELPFFFKTRDEVINCFMLSEDLTSWDEMTTRGA